MCDRGILLFPQVLDERQRQLEQRIEENRIQQEESLIQREQILREVEIANQMTHREMQEADDEKKMFKLQLKEQVSLAETRMRI